MFRASAVAAFVFVLAGPAVADAIDGDWCGLKSLHLTIKGPEITTPSGVTLKGNYHRHEFAYTAPPGDLFCERPPSEQGHYCQRNKICVRSVVAEFVRNWSE